MTFLKDNGAESDNYNLPFRFDIITYGQKAFPTHSFRALNLFSTDLASMQPQEEGINFEALRQRVQLYVQDLSYYPCVKHLHLMVLSACNLT
jgi:hypothetical protein